MTPTGCGRCHTCGDELDAVRKPAIWLKEGVDSWCSTCKTWRYYVSHGWGMPVTEDDATPCKEATT